MVSISLFFGIQMVSNRHFSYLVGTLYQSFISNKLRSLHKWRGPLFPNIKTFPSYKKFSNYPRFYRIFFMMAS